MKASAFNGDVEILLFCRVQTFHVLHEFTATSMPIKKRLNQSSGSIRLTAAKALFIKHCNWLFFLWIEMPWYRWSLQSCLLKCVSFM
jgi:hypothetical protein